MKFDIVGLDDSFGKHRFSNNSILDALAKSSTEFSQFKFVWWLEKVFLNDGYDNIICELLDTDWFGVLHVPLLTPNWAMYSQNNISKLYYSVPWRKALKRCKGLITLSEHMAQQVRSLYPDIPVYSLKHPVGNSSAQFSMSRFNSAPSVTLVGAWLRDYTGFAKANASFPKRVLLNHYAEGLLKQRYSKYSPDVYNLISSIECIKFLNNDDYDNLLTSTLVFIGMHETSANNALCECIQYCTPFVSYRHPAVIEYCGEEYPLLIDSPERVSEIDAKEVESAYFYLKENESLRQSLTMSRFLNDFEKIYKNIRS